MLVGREAERAQIGELLAAAREDGRSGALVLRGEAGIGKSALCDWAAAHAPGATVLRAGGVESESHLAFSALSDLLRPVADVIPEIPEPQAAALAGALAIGPPVAGDRFTICAATLSALAVAAETAPLLAVVDDAHWADGSSMEALLFTARRLDAEGVVLLFAAREGVATPLDAAGLRRASPRRRRPRPGDRAPRAPRRGPSRSRRTSGRPRAATRSRCSSCRRF